MKRQIRQGVFETNSSSVHSLTMCSKEEYERWENGELLFDRWGHKFIDVNSHEVDEDCYTEKRYWDNTDYETFYEEYTTPSGETVVAFGYYGADY